VGEPVSPRSAPDAVTASLAGSYRLRGVEAAHSVTDAVGPRRYLHAGPPLTGRPISGPVRGALIGALLFEGEAADRAEAERLIDGEAIELLPCHSAGGVGAMAGVVTPSMAVLVVEHESGRRAFAPLNEGLGSALRFGNFDPATLARLAWMRDVLAPTLDRAIARHGGIDAVELLSQALRRGDECHNRNVATTAQLVTALAPSIVESAPSGDTAVAVLGHLSENAQFSLGISMATGKLMADRVHESGVPGLVTAIAANGQQLGVRVSQAPADWYVADPPIQDVVLLDGFTIDDVSPLAGDSPVVETIGLGASALSASPGLAQALGLTTKDAYDTVDAIRQVCVTDSAHFLLPHDEYRGAPVGLLAARIIETGITPMFSGGYAHRTPGIGRVGAGFVRVPMEVFVEAMGDLGSDTGAEH
jgi:hypothetical protein